MANFLYLFRYKEGWRPTSPEEMERLTRAWMDWMDRLRKDGRMLKSGERLDGEGRVVRGKAKAVSDGPYAESKDIVGGYLLIEAKDLDEAAELAKGCPNLEYDGIVEVRPIMSL